MQLRYLFSKEWVTEGKDKTEYMGSELEGVLICLVFIPYLLISLTFKSRTKSASLCSVFSYFSFFSLK